MDESERYVLGTYAELEDALTAARELVDSFLLTHHPEEREGYFTFCGHIHPSIKLKGFGRERIKLPCFFKSKNQMILPAFGQFTGTHSLDPKDSDEVFAIVEDSIIKV